MNQQQLIVRWVKASERLPQNNGEYLCRYVHPEASCYRGAAYLLYSDGQFYAEDEMANLEWLEEGGMQGEGERLREVLVEVAQDLGAYLQGGDSKLIKGAFRTIMEALPEPPKHVQP